MRFRIQGRALRKQHARNLPLVGVCRRMKRRPAAIVRIVYVGTRREQRVDRGHTALPLRPAGEADGEIQQRVAVGPALICQARIRAQQSFEAGNITGLQPRRRPP